MPPATFVDARRGTAEGRTIFQCAITPESTAEIHYILEAGSPVVRIEYRILWNNPETLLKILFPTHYNGSHARFGSPFGSMLRSHQPGEPYDEAQWEVAGSRWAMVADDGGQDGLFVVTEAKFGWTARSGVLGLSLLRSAALPVSGQGNIKDSTHRAFSDLKPPCDQSGAGTL